MNASRYFLVGPGFLLVGYLVYKYLIKNQPPASAEKIGKAQWKTN